MSRVLIVSLFVLLAFGSGDSEPPEFLRYTLYKEMLNGFGECIQIKWPTEIRACSISYGPDWTPALKECFVQKSKHCWRSCMELPLEMFRMFQTPDSEDYTEMLETSLEVLGAELTDIMAQCIEFDTVFIECYCNKAAEKVQQYITSAGAGYFSDPGFVSCSIGHVLRAFGSCLNPVSEESGGPLLSKNQLIDVFMCTIDEAISAIATCE